ncbi:L10-interacting MYB domain-containing protein-like [Cucumis melo var. makuwa]|uniref:L10-interacting MYB domain-containing protein-like n=1 Tax=Cucumis melo var. makuwa TaxID=1194695 RepID=A0A5A7T088_CUCMM|nr:L10-interacting MYB domain-containing protein-like [Cucumis melo var. makuwa]
MKNKLAVLKKDWQIWIDLVGNNTGLGWDSLRQTIHAPIEWWEENLKVKSEAAKFRAKGLQNADQLDILFKDIAVTGDGAWAPSQGFVPPSTEGNSFRHVGENDDTFEDMEHNDTNDTEYSRERKKKKKNRIKRLFLILAESKYRFTLEITFYSLRPTDPLLNNWFKVQPIDQNPSRTNEKVGPLVQDLDSVLKGTTYLLSQ